MRNPHGYVEVSGPTGERLLDPGSDPGLQALARDRECDTFMCNHCQRITHVPPKCDPASLGGLCGNCGDLICPRCVGIGTCTPFEEALARVEARGEARRSYGI